MKYHVPLTVGATVIQYVLDVEVHALEDAADVLIHVQNHVVPAVRNARLIASQVVKIVVV